MHEMKQLSKRNGNYMSSKRYLELKNFCLQYNEWKQALRDICWLPASEHLGIQASAGDPTFVLMEKSERLQRKINEVNNAILGLDEFIRPYIFEAVTTGKGYDVINAYDPIPCCKQIYYTYYREFFHHLDISHD